MGMVPYSDQNNQTYFLKNGTSKKGSRKKDYKDFSKKNSNGYSTAMKLKVSITANQIQTNFLLKKRYNVVSFYGFCMDKLRCRVYYQKNKKPLQQLKNQN